MREGTKHREIAGWGRCIVGFFRVLRVGWIGKIWKRWKVAKGILRQELLEEGSQDWTPKARACVPGLLMS